MGLKTFLSTKRVVLISMLTLILGSAHGQRDSTINRYFVIEMGRHYDLNETTPLSIEPTGDDRRLLFALKTNLLFDALSVINIEAEIPIGERWSVGGELLFPWWTLDNGRANSRRNRLQLLNGNLEGKYWWGMRASRPILTGWFTGVYAGTGTYDFEHHASGYQGDSFLSVGVSGGYAHTINKKGNLRMEYTLGVGYLTTFYHYYDAEFCDNHHWHAVEMRNGRLRWIGPSRAKVSLSWLFDCNIKRR